VPLGYDFTVSPQTDERTVSPGTLVTYTITITNTGLQNDEYQIKISGNTWETTPSSSSTGELAFLESAEIQVTVATPLQGNLTDTVTVKITSSSKEEDVVLTTTTLLFELYLPFAIK
jgi:hypothetical protein